MINWDKRFLEKIKSLGLRTEIYARYVDDILAGLNIINKGWKFDKKSNRIIFCEKRAKEDERTDAVRKAEIMIEIGNSLDENIQFTWDLPEKNSDRRMPVLELNFWIQEVEGKDQMMH